MKRAIVLLLSIIFLSFYSSICSAYTLEWIPNEPKQQYHAEINYVGGELSGLSGRSSDFYSGSFIVKSEYGHYDPITVNFDLDYKLKIYYDWPRPTYAFSWSWAGFYIYNPYKMVFGSHPELYDSVYEGHYSPDKWDININIVPGEVYRMTMAVHAGLYLNMINNLPGDIYTSTDAWLEGINLPVESVPEPATTLLFSIGLVALVGIRRKLEVTK